MLSLWDGMRSIANLFCSNKETVTVKKKKNETKKLVIIRKWADSLWLDSTQMDVAINHHRNVLNKMYTKIA